jgi:protein involved in plasmid replication-relaxation
MNTVKALKPAKKPFIITKPIEAILKAIHFYRYMAAQDVCHLLYSPRSISHVREVLSLLAASNYLYRFELPHTSRGNTEKIYTLGSKGRDYLANVLGLPVEWYFRPYKLRHFSASQVQHNIALTRVLVAAHAWAAKRPDFTLSQTRICYGLARTPSQISLTNKGKTERIKVIPDAWLLFEKTKGGEHEHGYPVLLEVDRGMEYREKFKRHVRSRLEFIKKGGAYSKLFGTEAVVIAYLTTGELPQYREARRKAMGSYTMEVLAELHKEAWAPIFRFCSFVLDDIYDTNLFEAPTWYRLSSPTPEPLFSPAS